MKSGFFRSTAAAAALSIAAFAPQSAAAQEVTLRSNDGSVAMQGVILDFADGFYQFQTELGVLRLSAARMICEGNACPSLEQVDADLVFKGSDTLAQGIMPLLMSGFASELGAEADVRNGPRQGTAVAELVGDGGFGDPIGNYLIEATNTDDGFDALLDDTANVALSARRIRPDEARALRAVGAGNMVDVRQERIVAVDPVTVIVNPSNNVDLLTSEQLTGIFSGTIRNWSQVGGPNAPITVVTREAGTAIREFFDERVLGSAPISADANVTDDNNTMAAEVNADPNAIGFVGYAFQRGAKPLTLELTCGIVATPSPFASKTEEYPLDRRLYMYVTENGLTDTTSQFLDFATSAAADGAIAKAGFVDLGITRLTEDLSEEKVQSMRNSAIDAYERGFADALVEDRLTWDRLSSTFRFASGSSRLDERGRIDLQRLVDYLAQQPDGTEVALVGFTDSDGAFDGNRTLAIQRARQVAAELDQLGGSLLNGINFDTKGYGELSPAACNDNNLGKRVNRRVEVWIRGEAGANG
ncbi:MAG: phosphate ABC transporter substrate-binding/OmpA family protein [Pseudomonadota bacterium]